MNALRFGAVIVAARLTIYWQGTTTGIILPVSTGQFTIDRNSAQRRSGEITVEILPTVPPQTISTPYGPQNLLPITPGSPLAPFGTEVLVELAVMQAGDAIGAWGWVPLGIYGISTSVIADTGIDLVTTLTLHDRSWQFSRWALLSNYTVPASDGTLQGEVVTLLSYIWNNNGPGRGGVAVPTWITSPNITGGSSYAVPAGVFQQGEDPWAACIQMATSAGYELFFDVNGTLTGKPIPGSVAGGKLSSLPVAWNFYPGEVTTVGTFQHSLAGTPYTTPTALTMTMTQEGVANDQFVTASGPNNASGGNTPQQAEAQDTNPLSPTYINGAIGDIPNFVYDANISSAAQALAEAQFNLGTSIASAWKCSVACPLNPLFDVDDVVTVTQPRLGLNLLPMIVDTINVSIRYDEQTMLTGRIIQPGT